MGLANRFIYDINIFEVYKILVADWRGKTQQEASMTTGIKVEEYSGVVMALEWSWGRRVELGDRIVSLGRLPGLPPQGALGRVSGLEGPDSGGHTGDVIIAVFDNVRYRMKVEDFEPLLH